MGPVEAPVSSGHPFNSVLETGVRAVVMLEAFYPRPCDLMELTWLDYVVVHTGDLEGDNVPSSLHPALPNRTGELVVRRPLVERSLRMMQQMHLVEVHEMDSGIQYCASENAPSYLVLLQAPYSQALKHRARWVADRFRGMNTAEIKGLIEQRIGRWTAEFRSNEMPGGALS
ncbi:ABC-three component system middle component 2 [Rhodanobacter sp. 115]|uniref:ABC-three component system middle component 2 n=1 Tax=Rhodanobacter sp. FW021-MT20 TaxID=1162282 RepID=UPI000681DB14|nr:ABC-three component system middle component 2 [Rhodanobacter sp. 115]